MDREYDVAIVGGGIAGSVLAIALRGAGATVAVVERTTEFKDRVRGEWLAPWGVAEARRLGVLPILMEAGGHEVPWNVSRSGKPRPQRTPDGDPSLTFFHPEVQETLLAAAADAGADVFRPAVLEELRGGDAPSVRVRGHGGTRALRARLVVGADGRNSSLRRLLGRTEFEHRSERSLASVRVSGLRGRDDLTHFLISPGLGVAMLQPQGGGYGRAYFLLPAADGQRFHGSDGFRRFTGALIDSGVPAETVAHAEPAGPLAAFVGNDSWIARPYEDGLAVVGDAAGISDPLWGMGISLAFLDARTLAEAYLELGDVRCAAERYALAHDGYFETVRNVENWLSEVLFTEGPEADARRRRAAAAWSADPSRFPDLSGLGPEVDASEEARCRLFAEDILDASRARSETSTVPVLVV